MSKVYLYKIWLKDREHGTNYLVSASESDQAKNLVCAELSNPTLMGDLRVGFSEEFEARYVSVRLKQSYGWRTVNAWDEWLICQEQGTSKVIASFRP